MSGACLEAQQLLQLIGLPPRTRCAMLPQRLRLVLALALLVCSSHVRRTYCQAGVFLPVALHFEGAHMIGCTAL